MISFLQEHSSLNTSYSVRAPRVFTPESKPNQSRVCAPSPSSKSVCVLTADGLAGSVEHEHCVAASAKPEKIIVSPRVPASGNLQPRFHTPGLYRWFYDSVQTPFILEQNRHKEVALLTLSLSSTVWRLIRSIWIELQW